MQANDIRMDDGFSTTIELENDPTIQLWEKEVTPPGITGGGPIETTNMRNLKWRTKAAKKLMELTPINTVCAYATKAYPRLVQQINQNQRITISFADGAALRIWGYINEFTPAAFTEGEQPTATVVFQPTMVNNEGVEQEPEYIEPPGDTAGDTF